MNDQTDTRNTPSYLSHYGMFRAPFMDTIEEDMYFAEPTRTQRLDILLHLAQYGNELLLVTGPEGGGKTTMLQQFMKKIGADWMVCQINAHNMLTKEQLLSRISRGFGLPDENGALDAVTTNLKRRLDALLATHPTVIIAVDNAHILSTDVLNLLLEFAGIRNTAKGIAVRILLFSEPQIKILLASPDLQSKQTLPIRKIDLPPFDEQQTGRLIRHRVTTAGLVAKHVFNDAIVAKIYKYSQGWPGLITEIAHQVLFESTPLKRRDSAKPSHDSKAVGPRKLASMLGALALGAGLVGLLLFQDQINALFQSNHPGAKVRTVQTLPIPEQTAPVEHANNSATNHADTAAEFAVGEQSGLPAVATAETPAVPAMIEQSKTMTMADVVRQPLTPEAMPIADQEPVVTEAQPPRVTDPKPAQVAVASATQQPARNIPLAHQEDWIMQQDPNFFTLQMVAGYQEGTVLKFIERKFLPVTDLAYYFSLNRGKDWHSLVFGSYPNRDQAMGAAAELKKRVKHANPWIRSFKSVQDDILYTRTHTSTNP